jgi:hypothetical protein
VLNFQIHLQSSEYVRISRIYLAQRGDDPALAAHPRLDALLSVLSGPARADVPTRSRLLCAILAKHRAAPNPLWPAIVMHTLRGMLGRLMKRLVDVDRDEAGALVAAALLEALGRVRLDYEPEFVVMRVWRETRRLLFAQIRRDQRARPYWPVDEDAPPEQDEPSGDEARAEDVASDGPDSGEGWTSDEDDASPEAASAAGSGWVDPDTLADPESLVPIEDRLVVWPPTASSVSDELLLRAHAVRGGLRRLTHHVFAHESARHREHLYRQLLRRTRQLVARQAAAAATARAKSR